VDETVIRAAGLGKVYRLYTSPSYRFLDIFGLLHRNRGAYTEHAALDDVNLEIRRGEKVAIIGRNGAGKSTLLKLLTRVVEPTSGTLEVRGKAHALLQIGSGFHPDFTGRQNVYAYLAQLGIAGGEAARRCAEIIDFAELEEYIDQPVKTYSTGMAVRLMFSTSTAITPDLLVLDEVLGVGDAYFAHKSYVRIRELCDRDGATLLLVTHDIYSAVNICERVIWIDRGRVLMDGSGQVVVNAYEDSIRQQEEHRLRLRARQNLGLTAGELTPPPDRVLVEVHSLGNEPQPSPVYFSRFEVLSDGVVVAALPLDGSGRTDAHFQLEGSSWGEPVQWQGRAARALLNYGSSFHKVAAAFDLAARGVDTARAALTVRFDYWSDEPCRLTVHCFVASAERLLGELPATRAEWATHVAAGGADGSVDPATAVSVSGRQGTGVISVSDVVAVDGSGELTHFFRHGDPFEIRATYQIHQPDFHQRAQVLVAFHRDGVLDVCRICARHLEFGAEGQRRGVIAMRLPRLFLAVGTYAVTVMITEDGYFDRPQTVFYSINPGVYCSLSRVLEINVEGGGIVASGTAVVGEADWTIRQECR
jgi:ABC-type polysaccharide/polyol phosphate transport system ATPase subunit